MNFPVLHNQWNPVGGLFNVPNNMLERVSSIAMSVSVVTAGSQLGLLLAKMGMNQCVLDSDIDAVIKAMEVCADDPSKRKTALIDPTNPLALENGTYAECEKTTRSKLISETKTNFCKSLYSVANYVIGIFSTSSEYKDVL